MSRQKQVEKIAGALLFGDCGLEWRYAAELLREHYRTKAQVLVDRGLGDKNRFEAFMLDGNGKSYLTDETILGVKIRPIDYGGDK